MVSFVISETFAVPSLISASTLTVCSFFTGIEKFSVGFVGSLGVDGVLPPPEPPPELLPLPEPPLPEALPLPDPPPD